MPVDMLSQLIAFTRRYPLEQAKSTGRAEESKPTHGDHLGERTAWMLRQNQALQVKSTRIYTIRQKIALRASSNDESVKKTWLISGLRAMSYV